MEIAKGDDRTAEEAARLFGSPTEDNQMRHGEQSKKKSSNNCKIIIGVLLLCLLVVILAVVFFMKQRCDVKVTSCRNRCVTGTRDKAASCHCGQSCEAEGTCCLDYQEVCLEPSQRWSCSKFRCGEERLANSLCSCSDDCVKAGDCCVNYSNICKVGWKAWFKEECQEMEQPQCPPGFSKPPLILVSLDGFRASYLTAYGRLLPAIEKLRSCGTSTPYMRPSYPTKTFPNHYTIVTGLYPESHGIVDNKMYDVTSNTLFSLKTDEKLNARWYQGEPIWLTAMKNKLKTGTFFWPGSDVAINGRFPNYYKPYNSKVPFEKRIATLLEWLSLPQGERPDFYTLYLSEPDSAGHQFGPASSEVIEALLNVDRMIGMLMDGLKQRGLHRCVNIILLSDHGMEEASCNKAAYVSSYQKNIEDFIVIQGPAARIRPKHVPDNFFSFDYEGLVKNLSCRIPEQPMRPYLKEHLPKRMHYANNVRIERAHLYMKPGWQAALQPSEVKYCFGGFHGSDNIFKNMQSIFIGYGPSLKHRTVVPPFDNIEVYNLMCDLLDIPPAPNNGTHGSLNHLMKRPVHKPVHPAQLSHSTQCGVSTLVAADDLGCTCISRTSAASIFYSVWEAAFSYMVLGLPTDMGLPERMMNERLIQTNSSSIAKLRLLHLPYGIPHVLQENADYCVLHQSDYLNGYSKNLLMPLWVAYTLQPVTTVQPLSPEAEACVRADVRVPELASQRCQRYRDDPTLDFALLHPPNLNIHGPETDSLVTSNMAPMFPAFKGVWAYFHNNLVPKYTVQLNGVNVMSGPIFDKNYDGRFDEPKLTVANVAPIPTHFFVILTSCENSTFTPGNCEGQLHAQSFILPHRPDHTEACMIGSDFTWVEDWVQFHVARVRDIELLTGLSFFHDRISMEETLLLKTFLQTV